uniref:Uncharacterized protein n=1 Tax=Sphaerodactylus townsendi TaxID=933632 RepID=A0ACB8FAU3_9SAUR
MERRGFPILKKFFEVFPKQLFSWKAHSETMALDSPVRLPRSQYHSSLRVATEEAIERKLEEGDGKSLGVASAAKLAAFNILLTPSMALVSAGRQNLQHLPLAQTIDALETIEAVAQRL